MKIMRNFFKYSKGFLYAQGWKVNNSNSLFARKKFGIFLDKCLNQFGDNVSVDTDITLFFDGYVCNKKELCANYDSWEQYLIANVQCKSFPKDLRGGFCGFFISKNVIKLFVDHTGNRAVYYYYKNKKFIISNRLDAIISFMGEQEEPIKINLRAIQYMLEFGFMLDKSTFIENVYRVEPGTVILFNNDKKQENRYYLMDNMSIFRNNSLKNLIEQLDFYFVQAVKRQFDLDKKIGKTSLVELSGGLDSRMTTIVSHKLGYIDQVNVLSTSSQHLDYSLSKKIAEGMNHRYIENIIDKFEWFDDYKKALYLGNWSCNFLYSAPLIKFFENIDYSQIASLHTGVLGDAVVSTFYPTKEYTYAKPTGKENAYTKKLSYKKSVRDIYDNREKMSLHITGFLGVQASYIMKQNFMEWSSPFLDVDLMNFIYRIPFESRANHNMYIKWIENKYPEAAKYGWEKWGGLLPLSINTEYAKKRLYKPCNIYDGVEKDFERIRDYINFLLHYVNAYIPEELIHDSKLLLDKGYVHEKCMALSMLESVHQITTLYKDNDYFL